jgi:hypothetical protein
MRLKTLNNYYEKKKYVLSIDRIKLREFVNHMK